MSQRPVTPRSALIVSAHLNESDISRRRSGSARRAVAVLLILQVGVLLPDLLDGQDAPDPVAVAVPLGFRRPSVAGIARFHPHHLVAQCSVLLDPSL
ncbi:hypothetical protein [Mycobacterium sp.]|uniref:hypothetical protein n=1 Tax=Mycobacterium sp. TaxID=1785 RepID=UPI0028BD58B4|nr:hypothetical protein [Mycobacterium sp.]